MEDQTQPGPDAPPAPHETAKPAKRRHRPAAAAAAAVVTPPPANWYDRTPLPVQMFMQFGFAGLMAVIFVVQFRESAAQNREAQTMYRDDNAALRAVMEKSIIAADVRNTHVTDQLGQMVHRIDKVSEKMTEVNHQLQRTTDALRSAGVDLKKAADKMDEGSSAIPAPRAKPLFRSDGHLTGPGGTP